MKSKRIMMKLLIAVAAVCCICIPFALLIDISSSQSTSKVTEETDAFYIIDPDTRKYHQIDCPELEENKPKSITIVASKEGLKDQGYKRCKKCNP